jgi:nitrite reductase/ring-hydroxylating ferredoxin subunit/uncharacterized membrane protein
MSPSDSTTSRAYDIAKSLEQVDALDGPAEFIASKVRELVPAGPVKDALSGTWLGHALHPVLTDVPIGTWTSALLLDWLGGSSSEDAADRLIAFGLAAAAPTFATGWVEYADSTVGSEAVKRVGIFHAISNGGGALMMAASLAARRNGARGRGKLLALAGGAFMGAGAYLGGHLSFGTGMGVDQTVFEESETEWHDVLGEDELADGKARCVDVDDVHVLVVRHAGGLYALSDRCAHRGGPLHEGEIADGCVTCPWHGSTFRLRDGALQRGPSAYPQPAWEARAVGGRVQVRPAEA